MSKFGGGIGAPSKEERLKEAADIHLRLGQIQRYCELMVELGQVGCVCVVVVTNTWRTKGWSFLKTVNFVVYGSTIKLQHSMLHFPLLQ